jgi:FAD/FMN-containing dehydrogenase
VAKAHWLSLARSADELRAMAAMKRALDPDWILNPGAVLLAP